MNRAAGIGSVRVGVSTRRRPSASHGGWLLLMLGIAACSGGGDGPPASTPTGPVSPTAVGSGTLVVTVLDPLGLPAVGATVVVSSGSGSTLDSTTDAKGQVRFQLAAIPRHVMAFGPEFVGYLHEVNIVDGATLRISLLTRPRTELPAGGIANAFVGDVSADGRTLQVSLGIFAVDATNDVYAWLTDQVGSARVEDCAPDTSNDANGVQADCIAGPAGFDAAYTGAEPSQETYVEWTAGQGAIASSFETTLLLDQSTALATADPADRRLFAAKYLLSLADGAVAGQKRAVLGAFAADAAASGLYSALPQKPLTLFPLENPQLTSDGRSFFPVVDSLATLEGGASALLSAVDRALDFMGVNAWNGRRGIVVVGSGIDEACGSSSDCAELRDRVITKSRALGVRIVTIGLSGSGTVAQLGSMNLLAQSDWGGAALWLDDPAQFGAALADAHSFLADRKPYVRTTFRIESPTPGAFVSGRTVLGTVRFQNCPWDCFTVSVPFAVKIP